MKTSAIRTNCTLSKPLDTKRGDLSPKTDLTASLFIEISVPRYESERSCMCVFKGESILPHSVICRLDL